MPRRKSATTTSRRPRRKPPESEPRAEATVAEPRAEEPLEEALEEAPEPEPPAAPEPVSGPTPVDDREWQALMDEFDRCPSTDLPLDEGEEVMSQRLYDDGDLVLVTNRGRKVGISPDGWLTVLTGPPLDVIVPAAPKPPRKSWKEPRV